MKRGSTNLSLVVGVNKPRGYSSHDIVNHARRIFGERRIGHTGTLDPLAEGVLPLCVGPATRLDRYLVGHDKKYIVGMVFGFETNTCDIEGEVVATSDVPIELRDEHYARVRVQEIVGKTMQAPPAYSAVKVNGKPAYKHARAGEELELEKRPIEIYDADLLTVEQDDNGNVVWHVLLHVSKGTYVRSIVRDLGRTLGTHATIRSLKRTRVGNLDISECVSLETLEALKERTAIDPVRLLGWRYAFMDDRIAEISNGNAVPAHDMRLYEPIPALRKYERCTCTSQVCESPDEPFDGERIAVLCENRVKAIYVYNEKKGKFVADCVFSIGISRG